MTFTDLVAAAFDLPDIGAEVLDLRGKHRCVFTGQALSRGCRVIDVVGDGTGEFLETCNGNPHGYMSESAAQCWGASNPKSPHPLSTLCSRSFAVFGDAGYQPLVSRKSAREQGRPCWADFVYGAWERHRGQPCAIVLSTDTKKRAWPHGRAGTLGQNTPVLVYNPDCGIHGVAVFDWPQMLRGLEVVTMIYSAGFNKNHIRENLLHGTAGIEAVGLGAAISWERQLVALRREAFWPLIEIIMQKEETCSQ
jgi:hypothetical protein